MKQFICAWLRDHPSLAMPLRETRATILRAVQHPRQLFNEKILRDYSQFGETRKIRQLLGGSERFFVEVGANDGKSGDSAYGLVLDGWHGLMIEPSRQTFDWLMRNMAGFGDVECIQCAVANFDGEIELWHGVNDGAGKVSTICKDESGWFQRVRSSHYEMVPVRRLADLLDEYQAPKQFGLLIIDAEGMDLEVLQSLDFQYYQPRLIITEDYDPKNPRKFDLLREENYRFIERVGCNTFWLSQG
ncbi:MAG: FkbM family methyltransferase [Chromatiaceae bacterium]